jgi:hypothetical protein
VNIVPALTTVAALYLAYKKGLLKAFGPLESGVEKATKFLGLDTLTNPAVIIPIAAGAAATINGMHGLFREHGNPDALASSDVLKTSSARHLAVIGTAALTPYIIRENAINKARNGRRTNLLDSVMYRHAGKASTAALLSLPFIAKKGKQIKGFVNNKFIGKMFKRASSVNNVYESFVDGRDSSIKNIYNNVVKNEFWKHSTIKQVADSSANITTVLGLAELGCKEE